MQYVVPSEPPARRDPALAVLLGVGVFLTCFLATSQWIRGDLARPPTSLLGAKLDLFERDPEGYDLAFLGPSTVYRQCDPHVFDTLMAASGHPLRSINLGAPAMGGLEILFAVEQIVAVPGARLRWLLVDLQLLDLEQQDENLLSARVTWWHDLPTTWLAVQMILDLGGGVLPTARLLADHVRACAYNLSSLGRWRLALQEFVEGTADERQAAVDESAQRATWELGPRGDGFCSLDDALRLGDDETRGQLQARHEALGRRADEYQRRAAAKASRQGSQRELREIERDLFRRILDTASRAGVQVVFITSPDVEQRSDLPLAAWEAGLLPWFIDFTDPSEQRELFALDLRFDWNHLGARGAELYTGLLARRFAQIVEESGTDR